MHARYLTSTLNEMLGQRSKVEKHGLSCGGSDFGKVTCFGASLGERGGFGHRSVNDGLEFDNVALNALAGNR